MDKSRYKRLAALYTTGTEVEFKDGTVLWMQVLNSFEQDEARNAAQVAKARLTLALNEVGSDEKAKLEGQIAEEGREQMIQVLADSKQGQWLIEATEEIVDDPEWSERMMVLERADDPDMPPMSDEEKEHLAQINREYFTELNERLEAARRAEVRHLETLSEDDLRAEYLDLWIERRGADQAMAAYRTYESYFAARACEGVKTEHDDGSVTWDHSKCDGHRERAFDDVSELRELPDDLQDAMVETMASLNMTAREAKDSGSATSSSDSSRVPNAPEDSTASTPAEPEPSTPPGT